MTKAMGPEPVLARFGPLLLCCKYFVPHMEEEVMDPMRPLDVAQFLLKLMKERVNESRLLLKTGVSAENNKDIQTLVDEADLLRDGFDIIMEARKKGD